MTKRREEKVNKAILEIAMNNSTAVCHRGDLKKKKQRQWRLSGTVCLGAKEDAKRSIWTRTTKLIEDIKEKSMVNKIKEQFIKGRKIEDLGSMDLYILANLETFKEEFNLNSEKNKKALEDILEGKKTIYELFGPLDTTLENEVDNLRFSFEQ